MVKKYPFSNKAAKAMIAATIAFTPVATTAGLFNANHVEAALKTQADWHFNSVSSLATYSQAIHNKVSTQADVIQLKKALDSLTAQQWINVVTPILEPTANQSEVAAAAALAETYIGLYLNGLTSQGITDFIEQTDDNFNGATPAQYLQYLENAEEKLYAEYVAQTTDGQNDAAFDLFKSAVQSLKLAEDPSNKIQPKIQSTFNLTNDTNVQTAGGLLVGYLIADPNSTVTQASLKSAGLKATAAWDSLYNQSQGGGPGPGPSPDPDPDPDPNPVPGPGVETPTNPGDPVEVTPLVVEGATEVTVTIPTDLQQAIIAATPSATTEVVISVEPRTDGKPVVLDLPASLAAAIKAKAPAADIVIDAGDVSYVIPLSKIDLTALAAGLGGNLSALTLRISIDQLTDAETNSLEDLIQAKAAGTAAASSETKAASIVSDVEVKAPAVKVKVELAQNGTVLSELKSFGNVYVNQEFTIDGSVKTNNATGVVVAADGSLKALPTTFKTVDKKQVAVVGTLANSDGVYTVIESSVTFPDVNGGKNWAEKYIETLSSKFIIAGTTAGTYKPDQDMTRSQFAVLLSRALGLPGTTAYDGRFKDVKGNEWFNANGEFMAAVKYGIIAGKPNGTFAPDDKVTRAEAAAMIGRALDLSFINTDGLKLDTTKKLSDFKDAKEIGASTRAEVLKVYQAGIMSGASNKEFNPNDNTKRDQMARILAEFLMKANLMQDIK